MTPAIEAAQAKYENARREVQNLINKGSDNAVIAATIEVRNQIEDEFLKLRYPHLPRSG